MTFKHIKKHVFYMPEVSSCANKSTHIPFASPQVAAAAPCMHKMQWGILDIGNISRPILISCARENLRSLWQKLCSGFANTLSHAKAKLRQMDANGSRSVGRKALYICWISFIEFFAALSKQKSQAITRRRSKPWPRLATEHGLKT